MVINVKNKKWILFIVLFIGLCVIFFILDPFNFFNYNNDNNSYIAEKSSTNQNSENNKENISNENNTSSNSNSNITNAENKDTTNNSQTETRQGVFAEPKEETISSFSTKIYSKDSSRQNNVQITCNTLNGTIVKSKETFSFCNTVGPSTKEKGYQEADIFDHNGKKKKGFGGGNCQVSTTLYNAVLAVPTLEVTERHEHSNYVPYIEDGKDAAVAYGSYDLKFVNNTGSDIKILASASAEAVTVTIVSLKN